METFLSSTRLGQTPSYPDIDAPPHAAPEVEALYADPANLPPGVRNGPNLSYGRVLVAPAFREHHETVRSQMASTDEQRRHLMHLEYGEGPIVAARYSRAYSHGIAVQPPVEPSTGANGGVVECILPVDMGMVTRRGGLLPPVAVAIHELMHAARTGPNGEQARLAFDDAGEFTSRNERFIIGADNERARRLGEGLRDDHGAAGKYQTVSFESVQPVQAPAYAAIQAAQRRLTWLTQQLDATGDDAEYPSGEAADLAQRRRAVADEMSERLDAIDQGRSGRR